MEERLKVIGHIRTDFNEKFGIPRQSNLSKSSSGSIYLEPEFRVSEAFRGLENFEYIWLLWHFNVEEKESFTPTVRPPRLGGNKHVGVFATRSPFRPNHIGLSSVKLDSIEYTKEYGPVLHVSGVDMLDNTEIYDIKPYLKYVDSHDDANDGFAEMGKEHRLNVFFTCEIPEKLTAKKENLIEILSLDPRPSYQDDPDRVYGILFAAFNVRFQVKGNNLYVNEIIS